MKENNDLEKLLKEQLKSEIIEEFEGEVSPELKAQLEEELKFELKKLRIKEKVKEKLKKEVKKKKKVEEKEVEYFERFSIKFRLQHILLIISVIILIITGLPLKFPESKYAIFFFKITGEIGIQRILHRIGASGLIIFMTVHMFYIIFDREGRMNLFHWFPRPKDFIDVINNVLYFIGLREKKAKFDRFSYVEKFDYWAVYWGCMVMIGSGLLLWFQDHALMVMPKFILDMAHEAHSDEALLATLAIVIWHFYNVHLNPDKFPMNWTWWTGKISKEEMLKEHLLEYERIMKEKKS